MISNAQDITRAREAIAAFVHASVDKCVFVKNASTGIKTVLRNLDFSPGDVIVYFATVYNAVEQKLESLAESTLIQYRKVEYTFRIEHEEIVKRFLNVVKRAKTDRLNV